MTRALFSIVMCMYFFAHAFVCDAFMFRLAPTIHCILTSVCMYVDNLWSQYDLENFDLTTHEGIPLPKDIETEVLQIVMVLLVTRNVNEFLATYGYLQPLDGHDNIYKFDQGRQQTKVVTYYIGRYGACPAAIRNISSDYEMHNSTLTDQCFPNLGGIISVGVTRGIKGVAKLCDVLVSSTVVNFDISRVKEEPNAEAVVMSPQLSKLFAQPIQWPNDEIKKRLSGSGQKIPNVKSGAILNGPQLVDDQTIQKLVETFAHEAIGVEIGGPALFSVNQGSTSNTIIVKAVCDFGDGNNIEKYQPTAALLAADLVHECLTNPAAHEALKGLHICINKTNSYCICSYVVIRFY